MGHLVELRPEFGLRIGEYPCGESATRFELQVIDKATKEIHVMAILPEPQYRALVRTVANA